MSREIPTKIHLSQLHLFYIKELQTHFPQGKCVVQNLRAW